MMATTDFFWTDSQQATERLVNSYILYENSPVLVAAIGGSVRDPVASIREYPTGLARNILLSDKGFHRFRKPLPLGWVNNTKMQAAILLERRPVRGRTHGYTDSNVNVGTAARMQVSWRDYRFSQMVSDPGYKFACVEDYPTIEQVIDKLPVSHSVAISRKFAIQRDDAGIRWLYRGDKCIGLFPGNDSIMLLQTYAYMKEEISDDPQIKITNIKEF